MLWMLGRGIAVCSRLPIAVKRCRRARCSRLARVQPALSCLLLVAFVVIGTTTGCGRSRLSKADVPGTEASEPEQSEAEVVAPVRDYKFVSERNVFRPLVVAPRGDSGGASSGSAPVGRKDGSSPSGRPSSAPTQPPNPTADLAITGITETTDGLRVLIEKISTREGKYAAVGDVVFGFTVQGIGRGSVALVQGDKEYELKLGEKEIQLAGSATATEQTAKPETGARDQTTSSGGPTPPGAPGTFDWRNMSPEDRRAAMERRRSWWEGLSEEDRDRYRSRSGSGRGSDRGRRGPPGR